MGNTSENVTVQSAGATGGGTVEINQSTVVDNAGIGTAETGLHQDPGVTTGSADATGNVATNATSQSSQASGADDVEIGQDIAVDNDGEAQANSGQNSGGDITTGNARAVGNTSETVSDQSAGATGGGTVDVDQATAVSNDGVGTANTGFNVGAKVVTGNADASGNQARNATGQNADVSGADQIEIGQATGIGNLGNGTANTGQNGVTGGTIRTGNAEADGNIATTSTRQGAAVTESDPAEIDQGTGVSNQGQAAAETGRNNVVG